MPKQLWVIRAARDAIIVASPDALGFVSPRIVTEVKHRQGAMGVPDVRAFAGGLRNNDSGLYVSTGGLLARPVMKQTGRTIPSQSTATRQRAVEAVREYEVPTHLEELWRENCSGISSRAMIGVQHMAEAIVKEEPQGPQVSAILLAFNQAPALRKAIEALDRSTARETLEVVVADCGSHDGSQSVDADFPWINMLRMPRHFGAVKVMNIATRTAKAELLFFVSPNVEVMQDTVQRLAARMAEDDDCAAACPLLVDEQAKPVPRIYSFPGKEALTKACAGGELSPVAIDASQDHVDVDYPSMDALMVRKQFIRSMNFFDERRFGHYWADADLAGQIRRASKKARLYPSIRVTIHAAPDPLEGDSYAEADKVTGAAALLAKYNGSGAFGFKLGSAMSALGRFDLGMVSKVLGGQKFDGR